MAAFAKVKRVSLPEAVKSVKALKAKVDAASIKHAKLVKSDPGTTPTVKRVFLSQTCEAFRILEQVRRAASRTMPPRCPSRSIQWHKFVRENYAAELAKAKGNKKRVFKLLSSKFKSLTAGK